MLNLKVKSPLFVLLASALLVVACGESETTIVEAEPLPVEDEHDHGSSNSAGRLLVINAEAVQAQVFDLSNTNSLATIDLDGLPSAVYASGGYRYAALVERTADKVGFIDGGLWQEPHDDHFDVFTGLPVLTNYVLTGSRPTHFVSHDGDTAIFLDGDTSVGNNAGVMVLDDFTIADNETPAALALAMPMHGVAQPRGEYLLSSVRRADADSSSNNVILPDQVALYLKHAGGYELQQVFDVTCPDLHGAAQNETHIVFGCADGVLIVSDNGAGNYSAKKLANTAAMATGLRIGSIWGHREAGQFIGQASGRASSEIQYFAIDPTADQMALIDWQPMANAAPVARMFDRDAEKFLILDSQGYLTVIEPHEDGASTHWEFSARLDITEADVANMPNGMKFSLVVSQVNRTAYVGNPLAQQVLVIDLDTLAEIEQIELNYPPAMIQWLGIAEQH